MKIFFLNSWIDHSDIRWQLNRVDKDRGSEAQMQPSPCSQFMQTPGLLSCTKLSTFKEQHQLILAL